MINNVVVEDVNEDEDIVDVVVGNNVIKSEVEINEVVESNVLKSEVVAVEDNNVGIVDESKSEQLLIAETERNIDEEIYNAIRADVKVAEEKIVNIPIVEPENNSRVLTHKVELNDNLFSLAKKYYGDARKWDKDL